MAPHTTYLICATPRTGSTLLAQSLEATGRAGRPGEYFVHLRNRGESYKGWDISDYAGYVRRVLADTMTPNGVAGAKMMGGHVWEFVTRLRSSPEFGDAPQSLRESMRGVFPDLHHLFLTRRNKVRQAVSWEMAEQTGRWQSGQARAAESVPAYDMGAIDRRISQIVLREAALQAYFDEMNVAPLVVVYEDFAHRPGQTARELLSAMGIVMPEESPLPRSALQKLDDPLKEEWVQRYRREKQDGWWRRVW